MKKSEFVIVPSSIYQDHLSLRGYRNKNGGSVRKEIENGGFEIGDEVVLITKSYFEKMQCCGNCFTYFETMHSEEVENPDLFLCPVVKTLKYPHEKCNNWEINSNKKD